MSTTTDVLSLFKYDPVADADSTFNITQCLNNNWDKLDAAILLAIAAAGAYNPEESYAVGDYCTHSGKLHKCNTSIESGEAWNAAHWTATTVAAELVSVNLSLDNKAESSFGYSGSDLLAWAFDKKICGAFIINPDITTANHPFPGAWSFGNILVAAAGGLIITVMEPVSGKIKVNRTINGTTWAGWESLFTATPPTVRNLTLQSGFTANGTCTFYKTQENVVYLSGGVSGTLPANQDTQIGTLPADACPDAQRRRPATTNAGAAYIDIYTDGTVWAHPFSAASQCWFDCSFVAGGGS